MSGFKPKSHNMVPVASDNADSRIDYQAMELQRTEQLKASLKRELKNRESGKNHSLRRTISALVVEGNYQEAGLLIDGYIEMKSFYPAVQLRANVYVKHAKELINAIRMKREFPNLSQLSISKQQEILDHAIRHFDELKVTVKSIEQIVRDEAVKDVRSTIWVVRTAVAVIGVITLTAFVLDFPGMVGKPLVEVFTDFSDIGFKAILNLIPFL
jgi:hypothetical protein